MTKYRKKPVVIEATQFWINTPDGWPQGVYKDGTSPTGYRIDTLEGSYEVTEGDWIITGVKDEHYPCKPDIFEMTYELAQPPLPVQPEFCQTCAEIHLLLDADKSMIIKNAQDGYPEGRTPQELTLPERVKALCKYAADWKRWCIEAEALTQPEERNFCQRCGKRTADLTAIHTCTPPQPQQEAIYGMNQDDWKDAVTAISKVRDSRGIYLACRPADVFQEWFLHLGTAKLKKNT